MWDHTHVSLKPLNLKSWISQRHVKVLGFIELKCGFWLTICDIFPVVVRCDQASLVVHVLRILTPSTLFSYYCRYYT